VPLDDIWLVRHGATEWSAAGRHTGRTDIPLTDEGRRQAKEAAAQLPDVRFAQVLTSPLVRARETAALAGFADATPDPDLQEWDYGDYEGRTTPDIRREQPGWTVWGDGCPGGESAADVGARADRVLDRVRGIDGHVLLFAHGHLLRVLAARWIGLDPAAGALLALDTAAVSTLGYEREQPVLSRWNQRLAVNAPRRGAREA
jgi:probable phosphoglycerate mutase